MSPRETSTPNVSLADLKSVTLSAARTGWFGSTTGTASSQAEPAQASPSLPPTPTASIHAGAQATSSTGSTGASLTKGELIALLDEEAKRFTAWEFLRYPHGFCPIWHDHYLRVLSGLQQDIISRILDRPVEYQP